MTVAGPASRRYVDDAVKVNIHLLILVLLLSVCCSLHAVALTPSQQSIYVYTSSSTLDVGITVTA
jgi:uncharacterized protein YcfL